MVKEGDQSHILTNWFSQGRFKNLFSWVLGPPLVRPLDSPNENEENYEKIAYQIYNERSTALKIEYEEGEAENRIPYSINPDLPKLALIAFSGSFVRFA